MSFLERLKERTRELADAATHLKVEPDIQQKRLEICLVCPRLFTPTNTCKECGCFVNAKTWLTSAECPLKKW